MQYFRNAANFTIFIDAVHLTLHYTRLMSVQTVVGTKLALEYLPHQGTVRVSGEAQEPLELLMGRPSISAAVDCVTVLP